MKPVLLDLYCGAGGAAMGYHEAGFEVVGVDLHPQPRYPFEFHQGDALEYLETADLSRFSAIHASPPCQHYSSATADASKHPDLYAPTRAMLIATGLPFVIENVIGAPYGHGIFLCGSMFGREEEGEWIQRHRNFEMSWLSFQPPCSHPRNRRALHVTGHAFVTEVRDVGRHSREGPFDLACRLMGIDWMNRRELVESIPPAYTRYIGAQLMQHI